MHLSEYFLDNPVLKREVRARLRPRALRGNRGLIYGMYALAAVIVYAYVKGLMLMAHGTPSDAHDLFEVLVWGLLALISIIAPALSATAISQEREQQTWEILAVTRISAGQVILGKWLGRQLLIGIGFVIMLPFVVGSAIHGNVGAGATLSVFVFLLLCTNFFTALGLFCSSRARRTPTATAFALVTTALLCIGTFVVNMIVQQFQAWNPSQSNGGIQSPVLWVNPYYAMSAAMDLWFSRDVSTNPSADVLVISICCGCMLAFVIATSATLVTRFREFDRS